MSVRAAKTINRRSMFAEGGQYRHHVLVGAIDVERVRRMLGGPDGNPY
jgi:hypothetical protein